MITQFKIFEKYDQSMVDYYLNYYDRMYKKDTSFIQNIFKVPEEFSYIFSILYNLYYSSNTWKKGNNKIDDRIRNEVKKYAIELIIVEFEKDILLYDKIKYILDNARIDNIGDPITKYVFYVFKRAINKTPKYITNSKKFNI